MAVFTFVCRHDGDSWSAKQHGGDLEAFANSDFELQRHLSKLALSSAGSGAVSSSFSYVTPSSAVCQVIIGGGGGGGGGAFFGGGGGGGGAPVASGGAGAPAAEEKKEEEKKEEEESDDDMGFSLFD